MPIQFNCTGCANLFRVGDEMAGRKGKCPKCGVINQIPNLDGSMPSAAPPPPSQQFAGRPAAPRPAPPAPEPAEEVVAAAVAEDDDKPRAKRKKKGGSKTLILLLGGGAALLFLFTVCGVGGYFAYGWIFGANINSEQKYMPSNTQYVYSVRIDQANSSEFYKQLKVQMKDVGDTDTLAMGLVGINPTDVDRMTIAASATDDQMIMIVHTKQKVTGADIKGKLKGNTFKETKIKDLTIYENENQAGQSFCPVDSDLVIYGKFKDLKAIIERDKKPELPETMQAALKKADFSKTMALAVDVKDIVAKGDKRTPGANPLAGIMGQLGKNAPSDAQMDKFNKKIDAIVMSVDAKADVTLNLQVMCKDNATAEDTRKMVEGGLVIVKLLGEGADDFPKEVLEDLTNMKVSASGSIASANGTIKGDPLAKAIGKMQKADAGMGAGPRPGIGNEQQIQTLEGQVKFFDDQIKNAESANRPKAEIDAMKAQKKIFQDQLKALGR